MSNGRRKVDQSFKLEVENMIGNAWRKKEW